MKTIFALMMTLIVSFLSQAQACGLEHTKHTDRPSVHGMLVVGSSKIYLSHLPMFHTPHDYQVIIEAELDASSKKAYLSHLKNSAETVYTLVPETFVLPEMIKSPKPFKAQIYKGHFERGGAVIAETVTVVIKKIVYFKKFLSTAVKPLNGSYILFGNETEQFMAHAITAKPDFDQILKVKTDINLKDSAVSMSFKSIDNTTPLTAPSELEGIEIQESLYTETGDLSF
jgi:hypothetical protein